MSNVTMSEDGSAPGRNVLTSSFVSSYSNLLCETSRLNSSSRIRAGKQGVYRVTKSPLTLDACVSCHFSQRAAFPPRSPQARRVRPDTSPGTATAISWFQSPRLGKKLSKPVWRRVGTWPVWTWVTTRPSYPELCRRARRMPGSDFADW